MEREIIVAGDALRSRRRLNVYRSAVHSSILYVVGGTQWEPLVRVRRFFFTEQIPPHSISVHAVKDTRQNVRFAALAVDSTHLRQNLNDLRAAISEFSPTGKTQTVTYFVEWVRASARRSQITAMTVGVLRIMNCHGLYRVPRWWMLRVIIVRMFLWHVMPSRGLWEEHSSLVGAKPPAD